MMPQWISDIVSVAPWLGAFFVAAFFGVKFWKIVSPVFHAVRDFLDDWKGEPARPGVPERPGVMRRFATIEEFTTKYGPIIDKLDHEMHPNSGSSMADAVNRTEKSLADHLAACPAPQTTTINVNPVGSQP